MKNQLTNLSERVRGGGGGRGGENEKKGREKQSDFIELFNFQNKYLRAIGNNLCSGISNRPRHAIIYLWKTKGQRAMPEGGGRE
jgi:hypothetical protein